MQQQARAVVEGLPSRQGVCSVCGRYCRTVPGAVQRITVTTELGDSHRPAHLLLQAVHRLPVQAAGLLELLVQRLLRCGVAWGCMGEGVLGLRARVEETTQAMQRGLTTWL